MRRTPKNAVLPLSTRLAAVLELARIDPKGDELPGDAFVFGDDVGGGATTRKKKRPTYDTYANARQDGGGRR